MKSAQHVVCQLPTGRCLIGPSSKPTGVYSSGSTGGVLDHAESLTVGCPSTQGMLLTLLQSSDGVGFYTMYTVYSNI